MNNFNSILITSPIQNRHKYLPYYLNCIYNIKYPKNNIHIYFIINNTNDNSLAIIKDFKRQNNDVYASITIDIHNSRNKFNDERTTKTRLKFSYNFLSILRNMTLDYAVKLNVDYLLSIDSDIMVPPDTLTKLLSHNIPICSGLIYNGYHKNPAEPWRFPNIMRKTPSGKFEHIANSYVKNAPNLTESKLLSVDLTGAIVLISRDVCQNTSYGFHIQGEDAAWSIDCANKGYKLYCDVSAFSFHCMDENLLNDYIDKNNTMGEIL